MNLVRAHLLLWLLVVGACQRSPAGAEDPRVATCLTTHVRFLSSLAEGKPLAREPLACPDLYRETACGAAWADALRAADALSLKGGLAPSGLPSLTSVAGPCAKAYCGKLAAPLPALCSGPAPADDSAHNAALVDAVQALDVAILTHELGDPRVAAAIGWKANVFRQVVVPMPAPKPEPPPATLSVLEVGVSPGAIWVNGARLSDEALVARATRAHQENAQVRAVVRADGRVAHSEVVHVMDLLKQAGITKIAFGVAAAAPSAPR